MDMSWRKLAVLIPLATMTWVGPAASAELSTVDGPDKQVPAIPLPDEGEELDPVPIPEEPKPPKEPPRKLAACVMPKGLNIIKGTPGPDDIVGSPKDDLILGLGGNDTIRGGAGADYVFGGPGDHKLLGETDDDVLDGGGPPVTARRQSPGWARTI